MFERFTDPRSASPGTRGWSGTVRRLQDPPADEFAGQEPDPEAKSWPSLAAAIRRR